MHRTILLSLAASLLACSSGGETPGGNHACEGAVTTPPDVTNDHTSAFVGTWSGQGTITYNDSNGNGPPVGLGTVTLAISRSDVNVLSLKGAEPPYPALVQDDTTFELVCWVNVFASGNCSLVTDNIESGTGTLTSGTLNLTISGHTWGCANTKIGYTLVFSDATPITGAQAAAAEPLGAALRRALADAPAQ